MKSLRLRIPPLVWCLLSLSLMSWLAGIFPCRTFRIPAQGLFAVGFAFMGVTIALLGVANFRKSQTTVDPVHPHRTAHLVRDGVYRHTRNPMYLGMTLVQIGWFLHLGSLSSFLPIVGFVSVMTSLQIIPEEEALLEIFGEEYETYKAEVRRWF